MVMMRQTSLRPIVGSHVYFIATFLLLTVGGIIASRRERLPLKINAKISQRSRLHGIGRPQPTLATRRDTKLSGGRGLERRGVAAYSTVVTWDSIHDLMLRQSPLMKLGLQRLEFSTTVDNKPVSVSYDVFGKKGRATLFLAAPSFVPSRSTFVDMATSLCKLAPGKFLPILTELPGYGVNDKALTDLDSFGPSYYREYLPKLLKHLADQYGPIDIVSAGHAGFYSLDAAKMAQGCVDKIFLVNPTYRGPLTTVKMKNQDNPIVPGVIDTLCGVISGLYALPEPLGQAVHKTQCSRESIQKAMVSHVYENPENVTAVAVELNRQYAAEGERWGKCAFLVGKTDPYPNREDAMLAYQDGVPVETRVCVGAKEEDIFRKDLQFLTDKGVELIVTDGAQRNFVEFPDQVATAAVSFFTSK
ncbi:hypothetical protein AAMO2058_000952800 [Amorphochlora amoebiformis]